MKYLTTGTGKICKKEITSNGYMVVVKKRIKFLWYTIT